MGTGPDAKIRMRLTCGMEQVSLIPKSALADYRITPPQTSGKSAGTAILWKIHTSFERTDLTSNNGKMLR